MQSAWPSSVIALVALGLCATAQEPFVPREELRSLERVATELARAGREEPWRELIAVLAELGMPPKDHGALRQAGEAALSRVKKPAADVSRIGKGLRDATSLLSKRLSTVEPDERKRRYATLLLSLDSDHAAANELLGHERWEGGWGLPGEDVRAKRRAEIQAALRDARNLEFQIDIRQSQGGESTGEKDGGRMLGLVLGRSFVTARFQGLLVHSARSADQTRRILLHSLRALALSNFVAGGRLELPRIPSRILVMLDSQVDYGKAIEVSAHHRWIDAMTAERATKMSGFEDDNHVRIEFTRMEVEAEAALLVLMDHHRLSTPALTAGHLNWVCKAFLGTSIPTYSYVEVTERLKKSPSTSSSSAKDIAEREEAFRLAEAGLAGSRTFMRYLAARREDPSWSQAMKSQLGEIQGEDLLKAMLVAEYLMEQRMLGDLDAEVRKVQTSSSIPDKIEKALGEPLPQFEEHWRAWLLGLPEGLTQRLSAKPLALSGEVMATLTHLNRLRENAFQGDSGWVGQRLPVGLDVELSDGCRAHAEYLVRHPEMAARWPDAHEENPEHPEWTATGAWAGGHSVIAPGGGDGVEAIDQWMGTFYHRTPLLDPGLLRIGLGQSRDCVVLDSGSMVTFCNETWHVGWPHAGATDVPTKFVPELPNPVPGEDQSRFGYPITLQVGVRGDGSEPHAEMRLLDGNDVVPCWYSTPQKPTYVELAPPGAFCLIPKAHLRPSTTYTVEARFPREKNELRWKFRTGSR